MVIGLYVKTIALTNGGVTVVDDDFVDDGTKWFTNSGGYIQATKSDGKGGIILLHRLVMDAPKGVQVDHRKHRLWDNRKENLRLCTNQENGRNRVVQTKYGDKIKASIYKGVYRSRMRWIARIMVKGKRTHLGTFDTDVLAAIAYNEAALLHYGEFALLNVIDQVA